MWAMFIPNLYVHSQTCSNYVQVVLNFFSILHPSVQLSTQVRSLIYIKQIYVKNCIPIWELTADCFIMFWRVLLKIPYLYTLFAGVQTGLRPNSVRLIIVGVYGVHLFQYCNGALFGWRVFWRMVDLMLSSFDVSFTRCLFVMPYYSCLFKVHS